MHDLFVLCLGLAGARATKAEAECVELRAEVEHLKVIVAQTREVRLLTEKHYETEIAKLKAERDAFEEAADNAELFQFVFRKGDKP